MDLVDNICISTSMVPLSGDSLFLNNSPAALFIKQEKGEPKNDVVGKLQKPKRSKSLEIKNISQGTSVLTATCDNRDCTSSYSVDKSCQSEFNSDKALSSKIVEVNKSLKEDASTSVKQNKQKPNTSFNECSAKKQSKKKSKLKKCNNDVKCPSETVNAPDERSYLEILSSINDNLLVKMSELRVPSLPHEEESVSFKKDRPAGAKRRRAKSSKQKPPSGQPIEPHLLDSCEHTSKQSGKSDSDIDVLIGTNETNSEWYSNCQLGGKNTKSKKRNKKKKDDKFEAYMNKWDVKKGLENKSLIQSELRVNPHNKKHAYVSDLDNGHDIIIVGLRDRNRALEGDVVVIQIKGEDQWFTQSNGLVQRSGKVVYIEEMVHNRICVGVIKSVENSFAVFCPTDHRMPVLHIPSTSLPVFALENPDQCLNTLYLAKLVTWGKPYFAIGALGEHIGKKGDIEAETEGLLLSLGLDMNPVDEALFKYVSKYPYDIEQSEINSRLDLRNKCIFSIDPETARDLDDAVSLEQLGEDEYQVGVHISDVTYFLDPGTPLDKVVSNRATTIYLVQKVIHMLPVELCMMCSLLPGQDKLAFSVIWRMNSNGEILETKFCRSVINSCCQLSYEDAQAVIEGRNELSRKIYNGFTKECVINSIIMLQKIAVKLREARFKNGALRIDQPKLWFSLDSDYMPKKTGITELKDSNRLIEEFMLQANMSVAETLLKAFPEMAFLRRHSPPKQNMMEKLEQSLHKLGIFLDTSSSGQLNQSIWHHATDPLRLRVLNLLCSKTMHRAEYYCENGSRHHYALNIPLYTHFTSPIRRYADIVVHRMLAAHLGHSSLPPWKQDDISSFAANCNKKKYAAKRAGELSSDLYLALYLRSVGNVETKAVVFNISSHSFNAHILEFAFNIRVYTENLNAKVEYEDNDLASSLIIEWNTTDGRNISQIIQVFSEVTLLLKPIPGLLALTAELMVPEQVPHAPLNGELG